MARVLHRLVSRVCSVQLRVLQERPLSIARDENYKKANVNGSRMEYLDIGEQNLEEAVIFLHGNPTSSYLWRNIIPHVSGIARCIAPDLIGMGRSQKLPLSMYNFEEQYSYLSKLISMIDLPKKVNLVVHDWGSALGFHWANQHRDRVKSISFMEALVGPINHDEFPEVGREAFKAFRSPLGEEMILDNNFFIEQLLPVAVMRKLTDEEMNAYRKPFLEKGQSRRPMLTFARQLIILGVGEDGPDSIRQKMNDYVKWLSQSESIPKLHVDAEPGQLAPQIRRVVKDWPNMQTKKVKGLHFLQEDSPDDIGIAVKDFLLKSVF